MPRREVEVISNSQADKAARNFRKLLQEHGLPARGTAEREAMYDALDVIEKYRVMHEYPLTKVTVGVRTMLETELGAGAPRPAQRFKRMPRILQKLVRFPHMRLSQMEDIGGCRAVFARLDDLRAVEARIRRNWPHATTTDYIARPKEDGYRSLHIIERRDDRLIEVQLRTIRQHEWAETIETWSSRLEDRGWDIKDGEGPTDLKRFAMAAQRLARGTMASSRTPSWSRNSLRSEKKYGTTSWVLHRMAEINHFLIVYNLRLGELVDLRKYGTDVDSATEAYAEIEREWRDRDDSNAYEIVLVGADSEETLHVTHSRYFTAPQLTPSF